MEESLCFGVMASVGVWVSPDKAPETLKRLIFRSDKVLETPLKDFTPGLEPLPSFIMATSTSFATEAFETPTNTVDWSDVLHPTTTITTLSSVDTSFSTSISDPIGGEVPAHQAMSTCSSLLIVGTIVLMLFSLGLISGLINRFLTLSARNRFLEKLVTEQTIELLLQQSPIRGVTITTQQAEYNALNEKLTEEMARADGLVERVKRLINVMNAKSSHAQEIDTTLAAPAPAPYGDSEKAPVPGDIPPTPQVDLAPATTRAVAPGGNGSGEIETASRVGVAGSVGSGVGRGGPKTAENAVKKDKKREKAIEWGRRNAHLVDPVGTPSFGLSKEAKWKRKWNQIGAGYREDRGRGGDDEEEGDE
ncbi:hypothetical protein LTR17_021306 [Elasticomyces elasticus]|nr:hypothetical protein LTR17_021306 [Elasticomyces elasticus]